MLPEAKFDMYKFKGLFVNCKEEEMPGIMEDFWKNIDKEGWSFW